MKPSERSQALQSAKVIGMQDLAQELVAGGHTLYPLVLGESDLPTPPHIVKAGQRALADGFTFYPPGMGFLELREAIAAKLHRYNRFDVDPASQIFTTNGSGLGLYLALLATIDQGDEVIISDPTYGPFIDAIRLAGSMAILVPQLLDRNNQLRWTSEAIERAISPRTKAIIINTPSAPTGTVLSKAELQTIAEAALRHNLWLISDEVFETLCYDHHHHLSIAALDPEVAARTITVFSFSKSYSMTGWRLGYNVGPPALISAMERLSMAFGRPAAAFTQQAGIAALIGSQTFISEMNSDYTNRRKQIEAVLRILPRITWIRPEGAFYIFLDFSAYGSNSAELAERVLREAHVILTPGTFYGPAGQGWLRLSFAGPLETTLVGLEALKTMFRRWEPVAGRA